MVDSILNVLTESEKYPLKNMFNISLKQSMSLEMVPIPMNLRELLFVQLIINVSSKEF